jgi:hypothetical protein
MKRRLRHLRQLGLVQMKILKYSALGMKYE